MFPLDFTTAKTILIPLIIFAMVFSMAFAYTLLPKQPVQAFWELIIKFAIDVLLRTLIKFLSAMIQDLFNFVIDKINDNFVIRNFLKYEAVLSDKRYLTDYLTGYIPNSDTQTIIRDFTYRQNSGGRDFGCDGGTTFEDCYYTRNANANRGFTDAELNPLEEDYLSKLKNLGDVWSQPQMWFWGLQDQSFKAQSEAKRASSLNITSDGYKTPFEDTASGALRVAQARLRSIEDQSINAMLRMLSQPPQGDSWDQQLADSIANSLAGLFTNFLNDYLVGGVVYDEADFARTYGLSGASGVSGNVFNKPVYNAPDTPQQTDICTESDPDTGELICDTVDFTRLNTIHSDSDGVPDYLDADPFDPNIY